MPRKRKPEDEMALNSFFAAVDSLGGTEVERAKALGISDRQLLNWRKGQVPRLVRRLALNPRLLDALRDDGGEFQEKQTSKTP